MPRVSARRPPSSSAGDPVALPAGELSRLLEAIGRTERAEITVECNPEDVTVGLLRTYAAAGVNRISLGVQSLAPHVLAGSAAGTARGGPACRGGDRGGGLRFFSVDLIYGATCETDEDWAATLGGCSTSSPGRRT